MATKYIYGKSGTRGNPMAVLPTGETINPASPTTATYYDVNQTAYILFKLDDNRTRPTRVLTSFGGLGVKLGDTLAIQHDQTGAFLGEYRVVGIHDFSTGEKAGDVPSMKIKHCVVK